MPFSLYYRPSFKRSLKRLGYEQKKIIGLILESLTAYYSSGCNLEEAQKIAPRFFYGTGKYITTPEKSERFPGYNPRNCFTISGDENRRRSSPKAIFL